MQEGGIEFRNVDPLLQKRPLAQNKGEVAHIISSWKDALAGEGANVVVRFFVVIAQAPKHGGSCFIIITILIINITAIMFITSYIQ